MVKTNNSVPNGKTKEKSERTNIGAKGGTTKMFPRQSADPSLAGTASPNSGRHAASNAAPKGGKTGIMGKQRNAGPSQPGKVSVGPSTGGDNSFKASGGKGHMAGFSPAANAKPR